MKTRVAQQVVAVLLCAVPGSAKDPKDTQRIYEASFEKVWIACMQAGNEKYTVTHSDKGSGVLSFKWQWNQSDAGVNVVSLSDTQTKVTINPHEAIVSHHVAKKFFESVDKNLK